MEVDGDPERIKERKERKKLVMKVLNAAMGSLANVQKAGWKVGGEFIPRRIFETSQQFARTPLPLSGISVKRRTIRAQWSKARKPR
jgi:hypothetical protein